MPPHPHPISSTHQTKPPPRPLLPFVIFPLLTALGVYTTWLPALRSGLFETIASVVDASSRSNADRDYSVVLRALKLLPSVSAGSDREGKVIGNGNRIEVVDSGLPSLRLGEGVLVDWTGVGGFDRFLNLLVVFYDALLDGHMSPGTQLVAAYFVLQMVGMWTLVLGLSAPGPNDGDRGLSYVRRSLLGLAFNFIDPAIVLPMFALWHVSRLAHRPPLSSTIETSPPEVKDSHPPPSPSIASVASIKLPNKAAKRNINITVIPYAVVLGNLLPVLGAIASYALQYPRATKQFWVLVWHIYPLLTCCVHFIITRSISHISTTSPTSPSSRRRHPLSCLFAFTIILSFLSHVFTLMLPLLLSTYHSHYSFSPVRTKIYASLSPLMDLFYQQVSPDTIVHGAYRFFLCDLVDTELALMMWGVLGRWVVDGGKGLGVKDKLLRSCSLCGKGFCLSAILGPAAAAAWMLWDCEELLATGKR
ncbi:hypothetical protein K402DRAFT_454400 [Aulographum hederae CBS 113979]|uniref:Uncharacterized protein n=1 Tax=Aulographum hederae CBS 113979 TaxID=1176131 RepID=A0A6G1H047_9PEZI|nr:hypothetical protein K402DRAFT_454400 [Aulographum hederae CBS 113979]